MTQPQPKKTGRSRPVVASMLALEQIAENPRLVGALKARRVLGLKRYGTELNTFNGRDMALDAVEELLDAMVYLHGLRLELQASGRSAFRATIAFDAVHQALLHLWQS